MFPGELLGAVLVDVAVLAQHVEGLQLLGDVVTLAEQLADLLGVLHSLVLLERGPQRVAEVGVALGVVLPQVQQLSDTEKTDRVRHGESSHCNTWGSSSPGTAAVGHRENGQS